MTYTPTREDLELAALACGKNIVNTTNKDAVYVSGTVEPWQPHLPTIQGKADLLDMIEKLKEHGTITIVNNLDYWAVDLKVPIYYASFYVRNPTLAEAALKVAAQIGAKMKGGV